MASSLEGNKLMAAILTAGIIGSGSGVLSRMIYSPDVPAEPAYKVEVAATPGEAKAADAGQPVAVLLAAASVDSGATVGKKCVSCHSFDKGGAHKVGPALYDIVNRPIGKQAGFIYSTAMAGHGGNWDYEALNKFLADPKGYVPGTKMAFAGLGKASDRADIIAYMRSLSENPAPLPQS